MRNTSVIQIVLILLAGAAFATATAQQTDDPLGSVGMECHGFLLDRAADAWYRFGDYTVETFHFLPVNYNTLTLAGVHLWLPDYSSLCWEWDGTRYMTIQRDLPVGADVNGNGIPDLLIQQHHHGNYCDNNTYLIELGPEPRFLYKAESWTQDGPDGPGYEECPVRLEDLNDDGVFELIALDTSHRARLPEAETAPYGNCGAPQLPVVYTPDESGLYRVATVGYEPGMLPQWSVEGVYHEALSRFLLQYGDQLAANPPRTEAATCTVFSIAMTLLYMGRPVEEITATVSGMSSGLGSSVDAGMLVPSVLERASMSRVMGEFFRE